MKGSNEMETQRIFMDAEKADELYKRYLKNRHYERSEDAEIRKAYRALAKGQLIVRALDSIRSAGLGEDTMPKLAIANAAADACYLSQTYQGGAVMASAQRSDARHTRNSFRFDPGTFPGIATHSKRQGRWSHKAFMPVIPADIRPRRGLENYHVLWEAEWEPIPPVDPYLLQRIGKTDMWLVLGMWDLTEVEREVLASRIPRAN